MPLLPDPAPVPIQKPVVPHPFSGFEQHKVPQQPPVLELPLHIGLGFGATTKPATGQSAAVVAQTQPSLLTLTWLSIVESEYGGGKRGFGGLFFWQLVAAEVPQVPAE